MSRSDKLLMHSLRRKKCPAAPFAAFQCLLTHGILGCCLRLPREHRMIQWPTGRLAVVVARMLPFGWTRWRGWSMGRRYSVDTLIIEHQGHATCR